MRTIQVILVAERATSIVKRLPPLSPGVHVVPCETEAAALANAGAAQVLSCYDFGRLPIAAVVAAAPRLEWVHSLSAGVENLLQVPELRTGRLQLTNSSGCNAPAIAEQAMAYILAFARGLYRTMRAQAEGRWERELRGGLEVAGATLGLIGVGAIGREVAWRAKGLGMRVLATRRRNVGGPLPPGVDELTSLDALLGHADYVVVCVPLTPETRHLLDTDAIGRMKPGAFLVNVARGNIVDESALVAALRAGHLAGAGLDVFETEPLPADSPLWHLPGVIITPHVAASSPHAMSRMVGLLAENLQRFYQGQPLRNLVDPRLGY